MKKNKLFIIKLTIILSCPIILTACSSDFQKHKNAKAALENKHQERLETSEAIKNDTTPPEFSCTMEQATYEVNDNIDYTRLQMSLTAIDDVDGDLTPNIEQKSSSIIEHQEGIYKITYEVSDTAGNTSSFSLPVIITSQYEPKEKTRLNNCIKAYNKLKTVLKSPSSLELYNINTNEDGSIVFLNYYAQNGFGAYIDGRVVYYSNNDSLFELEDEEIPSNFTIGEFTYEYDDIKDFSDYYHSDENE